MQAAGYGLKNLALGHYSHPLPPSVWQSLIGRAHSLETLSVNPVMWPIDETSKYHIHMMTVRTTLGRAVHLRDLTLSNSIDGSVWKAMSQLPLLADIKIIHRTSDAFSPPERVTFPALLFITLHSDINIGISALQLSKFPSLRSLNWIILGDKAASHSEVAAVFNAISDACDSTAFTELHLRHPGPDDSDLVEEPFQWADTIYSTVFQPLFRLTSMRRFHISTPWTWDLDDALVRDLAKAWPDINYLHLSPSTYWSPTPRITFRSLELLATRCPKLTSFGAVIDSTLPIPADDPALIPELASDGDWQYELTDLSLGHTKPQGNLVAIAAYLSGMFPNLQIESHYPAQEFESEETMEHRAAWEEVSRMIPFIVAVREQERERAASMSVAMDHAA